MTGRRSCFSMVVMILLAAHLRAILMPDWTWAQAPDCQYDREIPSLQNARSSFQVFSFRCAELELLDLLKSKTLPLETKAGAHMLLAAVYYEMLRDDADKRAKVLEQFKAAFHAFRNWRGPLDIQSQDFTDMMDRARRDVEGETASSPAKGSKPPARDTVVMTRRPDTQTKSKGKGWYKKWWVMALGVGVVGAAVFVIASPKDQPDKTLPGFPPPPGGKRR